MDKEELERLIELARDYVMTPRERFDQLVSFAYGNTNTENPDITREDMLSTAREMLASGRLDPNVYASE